MTSSNILEDTLKNDTQTHFIVSFPTLWFFTTHHLRFLLIFNRLYQFHIFETFTAWEKATDSPVFVLSLVQVFLLKSVALITISNFLQKNHSKFPKRILWLRWLSLRVVFKREDSVERQFTESLKINGTIRNHYLYYRFRCFKSLVLKWIREN